VEPQITIGLLTGYAGFPLTVHAFEGNMAGTKTMLPVIEAFMTARQLPDVTTVAGAGMISQASQKAIQAVGLSFIPGMRIPHVRYVVASRWIQDATGWSTRKFVRTARRYRTIETQAGNHVITAADPLPSDLQEALDRIHRDPGAHQLSQVGLQRPAARRRDRVTSRGQKGGDGM